MGSNRTASQDVAFWLNRLIVIALDLVSKGDRIERLESTVGSFEADDFVLAAGAWSPDLARTAGLSVPMQAGKGYSMTLDAPPQLPELCAIMVEGRVALTPMGGRLRVGGTMEIAGNDLYVANFGGSSVGRYNATTGAVINASFISGLNGPAGLAIMVPEPGTLGLGLLGGLVLLRRRRVR